MINPSQFRKKPVVIEAMPLTHGNSEDVAKWVLAGGGKVRCQGKLVMINTLEGSMTATPGDWVIRGVQGEHYPCKPDIFDATYDPVETIAPSDAEAGQ